jgi:hypothetical protein
VRPSFHGDSYDLVKRFFCHELAALGYVVVIDAMFTGTWNGKEQDFYRLLGAVSREASPPGTVQSALFLDPDTGINSKGGKQHVSFDRLAQEASAFAIVFAFDQSFSRQAQADEVMNGKLAAFEARGCSAMYYDSHARFLFLSRQKHRLSELRAHLVSLGLPSERLVVSDT